jgi:glycosyltransferase involved in cell wall biosynthesis
LVFEKSIKPSLLVGQEIMRISIIIFCYNEEGSVASVIDQCQRSLVSSNVFSDHEIIVINDGSSDSTPGIIESIARSNPAIRVIHHDQNMGIGMALRSGYQAAKLEYICAIPGDGQFDPKELNSIKPFGNDRFYSFYRKQYKYGPYRYLLTLFNRLYNIVFLGLNIKDVNWIKVFRKEQIVFINPEMRSSLIESEICAKLAKAGVSIVQVSSIYYHRQYGEEKGGSWKTLKKAASEMWVLYLEVLRFNKTLN